MKKDNEISLNDLFIEIVNWLKIMSTKWRLILVVLLLGSSFGLIYSNFKITTYNADLTYILTEQGNGTNQNNKLAAQFGLSSENSEQGLFSGSKLIDLMKSRNLMESLLFQTVKYNNEFMSFADYYLKTRIKNREKKIKKIFPLNTSYEKLNIDQKEMIQNIYLELINENKLIFTDKDKKTSLSFLRVVDEDEEFAKLFCEKLIISTTNFYTESKILKSKISIEKLEKQIDSLRASYNFSVNSVADANDEIFNINPSLRKKATLPTRLQVDLTAKNTVLINLLVSLENSKGTLSNETPLFQIIDKPKLPLTKNEPNKISYSIKGALISLLILVSYLVIFRRSIK